MARMGAPVKPTSIKLLQGTFRPDRALLSEPRPEIKIPPVPSHLSGEAKAEWARVSKELQAMGVLAETDRTALAAYCEAWADWVHACKLWEAHRESPDYRVIKSIFSVKKSAAELMHKFLVEFGMTPASRTRISASPKPEEGSGNPFENLG